MSADGQRFLIPQFENLGVALAGAAVVSNAAVASVLGEVGADRRAAVGSTPQSSAP